MPAPKDPIKAASDDPVSATVTTAMPSDAGEVSEKRRRWLDPESLGHGPWTAHVMRWAVIAFALWHIATNLFINEAGIWQNALHFGGFGLIAALSTAPMQRLRDSRWALVLDVIYGFAIFGAAIWVAYAEDGVYVNSMAQRGSGWIFSPMDWIAGGLVIFAAVDLTRRLTGWIIPTLILISLAYILFLGAWLPGVFRSASLPLSDVLFRSLYNDEGMFGGITTISSANITLFMIFGGFLIYSGASDFVIELSRIVAARLRGGGAYVAVISSALTGTISGSAVANTASTGVITIPTMTSNGFKPTFAAGVEAASSTGGQLVPPIMGAGAFVMASYTGLPYSTIVAVSVLPAILYFLSVACFVRIEVLRSGIPAATPRPVDRKKLAAGALNFVLPLGVMIWLLMTGRTPNYAASVAIAVLVVVSWATPTKMTPKRIAQALIFGMRTAVMTAVLLTAIGLVNNAITTSGVGGAFSLMIIQWSQGSLIIAIALVALASLILGMGLPVTAAYVILAILLAPALSGLLADRIVIDALAAGVNDAAVSGTLALFDPSLQADLPSGLGAERAAEVVSSLPMEVSAVLRSSLVDQGQLSTFLLVAHLIIFWLSQDSNVTPPVCLAAYTAAGIAGSKPMATGLTSWKIAKGLYIMPLLFAYTPLISGDGAEALRVAVFASFGIYAVTALLQRHAEGPLTWWAYAGLLVGAIGAFMPCHIWANLGGAVLILVTAWGTRPRHPIGQRIET
ncbi:MULTISPECIES: TRAP transporter fused permease subunit [unclassified Roseovarius]|uniref:TRAP transporter permease n=1 Tax=unclassified Roseovarius TaxID=2614913 RepID=UPI00273E09F7|nr:MULTISPECIES: TRAP transporter fused permease subunit [unclassified Roseovarius]